jgi:hypothetical protein
VVFEVLFVQEEINFGWVFLGKISLVGNGIISDQHFKCTIALAEIMDN